MFNEIEELKANHLYRKLETPEGVDFSSNDYLGLSQNNFLKQELKDFIEAENYLWRTSSRLISGTTELHLEVEKKLANFLSREDCILFNTGYCANMGVISALCKNSLIFSDEMNHASIIDGIKLSRSQCLIYKHNDMGSLATMFDKNKENRLPKVIITESLFSMDGDLAHLQKVIEIGRKYNALIIIDEAHATGVYGKDGAGLVSESTIEDSDKLISIHTGGKALGSPGAFVGCSKMTKELIINKSRQFIYTTGIHPINAFLLNKSVQYSRNSNHLREKLIKNINFVCEQLKIQRDYLSPIIPVMTPGNEFSLRCSDELRSKGLSVKAIRYPTVAKGKERIRLSIHADHSLEELTYLCKSIKQLKAKL